MKQAQCGVTALHLQALSPSHFVADFLFLRIDLPLPLPLVLVPSYDVTRHYPVAAPHLNRIIKASATAAPPAHSSTRFFSSSACAAAAAATRFLLFLGSSRSSSSGTGVPERDGSSTASSSPPASPEASRRPTCGNAAEFANKQQPKNVHMHINAKTNKET
jgi:hypothetical protein